MISREAKIALCTVLVVISAILLGLMFVSPAIEGLFLGIAALIVLVILIVVLLAVREKPPKTRVKGLKWKK